MLACHGASWPARNEPIVKFLSPASCRYLFVGLVLIVGAGSAAAERADRDQPMHIESDELRYDSQQQRSIFSGRVNLSKGSIVMRGQQLDVRQADDGAQTAQLDAPAGGTAFFRQKREGLNEFIEGEASTIRYDSASEMVSLEGQAEMRRLVGDRVQDRVQGQTIVYNTGSEIYTVKGSDGGGRVRGRVRATLIPAPAVPDAGDAGRAEPRLRSSDRLQP